MNHLEITDLHLRIGDKRILSVEHARFQCGQIYGIVGPSGSGKSTFLKLLNLLEKPTTGRLHFWGTELDLTAVSQASSLVIQRQMALVAQKPVMFQTTVYANVAMGLRFRRCDKATVHSRVMQALERVGMLEAAKQQASTLSGGEAQRIALARAIVLEPKLLLLDEPTASLDPQNVAIFEQVMRAIHQQGTTAIVIVTHNLPQARRLADECLFLHKGELVEMADTHTFFTAPVHAELADFLSGRMIY